MLSTKLCAHSGSALNLSEFDEVESLRSGWLQPCALASHSGWSYITHEVSIHFACLCLMVALMLATGAGPMVAAQYLPLQRS